MNVVLLPNYNRPEMGQICLEQIITNPDYQENIYVFVLDEGFSKEVETLAKSWGRHLRNSYILYVETPKISSVLKQSYAIYSAYQQGLKLTKSKDDLIFLIEDDVFCSNLFFDWHRWVQSNVNSFCAIGTENHNLKLSILKDENKAGGYYLHSSYESLGVSFKKRNLELLLNIFTNDYFQNPQEYCLKNFKVNLPHWAIEQDGLIHRYIIKNELKSAWAWPPVSFHFGIYGKSRQMEIIKGQTIQEKVNEVKNLLQNFGKLKEGKFFVKDCRPTPLKQIIKNFRRVEI